MKVPVPPLGQTTKEFLSSRWHWGTTGRGPKFGGRTGWSLTLEEGSKFTGQSSRRELVFALLLGADDFPGGGGGESWGEARTGTEIHQLNSHLFLVRPLVILQPAHRLVPIRPTVPSHPFPLSCLL